MKRLSFLVLVACGAGLSTGASSQDHFLPSLQKFHVVQLRYLPPPSLTAVDDEQVVFLEKNIDLSSGETATYDFAEAGFAQPVRLIFDRGRSTVTFERTLEDIGGGSGGMAQTMKYESYDDLGLSGGDDERNVRLFFTSHFLYVEVSGTDRSHHEVKSALFFVGPPHDVHKKYLNGVSVKKFDYKRLRDHVQHDCIDTIRAEGCRNFDFGDVAHLIF